MPLSPFVLVTCYCYPAGDIKVLEHLPQLTSVNMASNISTSMKITGECSVFGGRFLSELRTSALFLEEISSLRILREFSRVARRTCRNFLEFSSLHSNSLARSHLPCLLVNPHLIGTSSLFFMLLLPQASLKTSRRLVLF